MNTEDTPLRVGVIGAGNHSKGQLYPCLTRLPVELVAVCDLDQSLAAERAQTYGAEAVYTDHEKMLQDQSLDAVLVCVGPAGHVRLAIDVMEAGLPVYTEKPPAPDADGARRVLETSRRTGQICMTGFMKRFAPSFRKARDAVRSDDFGASLLRIDWSFGALSESFRKVFFLDFGIHHIDLARYMFGEVDEVYARAQEDKTYAIMLAFSNGALGTLGISANRGIEIVEDVSIIGSFGNYITINRTGRMVRYRGSDVVEYHEVPLAFQNSLADVGYEGELAEFFSAVRERREPESSIASSYQTMRLYEAILHSIEERRPVQLSEIE